MDYLTGYPVSAHPETWPLNSVYLSVLERQIKFWQEKGYEWKWSAECEFTPSSPGDILDLFKSEKIRIEDIRSHEFYSLPPLELLEALQSNPVDHKDISRIQRFL